MARKYTSSISVSPYDVALAQPLDVRLVVENVSDLLPASLLKTTYIGMVVYVLENSSLYVCYKKPARATQSLTNVEDGWKKVDVDYSTRIVETESNLTDGTTILFPYQGMMAYVKSESALYVLLTKNSDDAKDITNWRKISSFTPTQSIDKIGIDVDPEGGTGFKIMGNKGVIVDDYVNAKNYIKAKYLYTSKGVNSFEPNPLFDYDVKLTKDNVDDAYIELYKGGDNWMKIHNPNVLGLSVTINDEEYVSDTPVSKETFVCFGVDIKFHEGWTISYGEITKSFDETDYELIDIYRSENSPEVYAYYKDIDVRVLTEDDMTNIAESMLIDLDFGESDGSDSDVSEPLPLQKVIVNMNNAITKLEQTTIEPETIDHSDIDNLFS
jgi:hypothetical protein